MGRTRRLRVSLLRLAGTAVTALLSVRGLSGCMNAPAEPTYGVPGFTVQVTGSTRSAADSSIAPGITVRLDRILAGDTTSLDEMTSGLEGVYEVEAVEEWETVPDGYALRIAAEDADTTEHGSFGAQDTVIPVTQDMLDEQQLRLDLDLFLSGR